MIAVCGSNDCFPLIDSALLILAEGTWQIRVRVEDGCGVTLVQPYELTVTWPDMCPRPAQP